MDQERPQVPSMQHLATRVEEVSFPVMLDITHKVLRALIEDTTSRVAPQAVD